MVVVIVDTRLCKGNADNASEMPQFIKNSPAGLAVPVIFSVTADLQSTSLLMMVSKLGTVTLNT